jgi:hypothetical protein
MNLYWLIAKERIEWDGRELNPGERALCEQGESLYILFSIEQRSGVRHRIRRSEYRYTIEKVDLDKLIEETDF